MAPSDGDSEKVMIETTRAARRRLKVWKTEHGELTYTEALHELMDGYDRETALETDSRTEVDW